MNILAQVSMFQHLLHVALCQRLYLQYTHPLGWIDSFRWGTKAQERQNPAQGHSCESGGARI